VADETFEKFMQRERARLNGEREAIFTEQQELENKLAALNRELAAIDAYEAAKSGKAAPLRQSGGSRGQRRSPRGSKREAIIELIKQHPAGLSRGELLERLNLKGDKSGEMSVSNALTALTKSNQLARHAGKYRAG
jgi:hypothetical protein